MSIANRFRNSKRLYNTARIFYEPNEDYDYMLKNRGEDQYHIPHQSKTRSILIIDRFQPKPIINIGNLDSETISQIIKHPHKYNDILSRFNGYELVYDYN
jgi:hypothetical protein